MTPTVTDTTIIGIWLWSLDAATAEMRNRKWRLRLKWYTALTWVFLVRLPVRFQVLPVRFFFYGLSFPPLLSVSSLERKWVERNQKHMQNQAKTPTKLHLVTEFRNQSVAECSLWVCKLCFLGSCLYYWVSCIRNHRDKRWKPNRFPFAERAFMECYC